jgi:hypothetical protein
VTALAKATKTVPSSELELTGLATARAQFVELMQSREDRVRTTAVAAAKRRAERSATLMEMRQELEDFAKAMVEGETAQQLEHRTRAEARAKYQSDVLALYDQRIAMAKTKAGTTSQTNGAPSGAVQTVSTAATGSASPPIPADQQAAQLLQLKEELEQFKRQSLLHQRAVEKRIAREAAELERFQMFLPDCSVSDLPVVTPPSHDQLLRFGQMHQLLQSWNEAGAVIPFTLNDLICNTKFGKESTMVLRSMLGSLWTRWFPAGEPEPMSTVPRQAAILCLQSLDRLKQSWMEEQQVASVITQEAAGSYSRMCGTLKKRRSQGLDVEMELEL